MRERITGISELMMRLQRWLRTFFRNVLFVLGGIQLSWVSIENARAESKTPSSQPSSSPSKKSVNILDHAQELVGKTSKLRGLRAKHAIEMGSMTREQILAKLQTRIAEEYTERDIAIDEATLKVLGVLPETSDLKQTMLRLLTDQIAGFYDPKEKRLHIAEWLPLAMQTPTLVHEICHALQDQHVSLLKFSKPNRDNSDQQLAGMALVEGDCTGVMIESVLQPMGFDLGSVGPMMKQLEPLIAQSTLVSKAMSDTPLFLRESLIFPYLHGLSFIQQLRVEQPWSAVTAMFRRPPESTEQVLHPEKYRRREKPRLVRFDKASPLPKYSELKQDTLGEFQLRTYLKLANTDEVSERSAEGWGGDRLIVFQKKAESMTPTSLTSSPTISSQELSLAHISSWDSSADAVEFVQAQRRVFAKQLGSIEEATLPTQWRYRKEGNVWLIEQRGEHVLVLHQFPADDCDAAIKPLWHATRIDGRAVR